jgi:hypothetical protein
MTELLHHGSTVNSEQADRTIVLVAIVSKKLDSEIPCPDERLLYEEGLYRASVPSFEDTQLPPSIWFDRITIRDRDTEVAKDRREEFVIRQDDGIDENVIAQLDNQELV